MTVTSRRGPVFLVGLPMFTIRAGVGGWSLCRSAYWIACWCGPPAGLPLRRERRGGVGDAGGWAAGHVGWAYGWCCHRRGRWRHRWCRAGV